VFSEFTYGSAQAYNRYTIYLNRKLMLTVKAPDKGHLNYIRTPHSSGFRTRFRTPH